MILSMSDERGIKSLDQESCAEHSGDELAGRASSVSECLRFPQPLKHLPSATTIALTKPLNAQTVKKTQQN